MPTNWDCWSSHMTKQFDQMTNHFLSALTKQRKLPFSAMLISLIAVNNGSFGITDPRRRVAISTFILNMRRYLQFSLNRMWIGHAHTSVSLSQPITDLYSNWETSISKSFRIFNQYCMDIATVCVKPSVKGGCWEHFLHNSSINTCRKRVKHVTLCRTYKGLGIVLEREGDEVSKNMINEILDPKYVQQMLDMSRIFAKNRLKNNLFCVSLKRKLRLNC